MKLRSHKRKRSSVGGVGSRDRLSEMPDEVIVHILSFMPIVYAVRTVLLRRFGNLWTLVHTLKLDMLGFLGSFCTNHEWDEKDDERFCIFVRNLLVLHKRPTINKFHLCVEFGDSYERTKASNDIKTWLRFALDRQANEIKFSDGFGYGRTDSSLLPNFTSQSLVTLTLGFYKIDTRLQVNLPSLKKLSLDCCRMSTEEFQRFISGCCSLQELVIVEPSDVIKMFDGAEAIHLSCVATQQFLGAVRRSLFTFRYKWKRVVLELKELHEVYLTGIYRLMLSLEHLTELIIYTTEDFKACAGLCPSKDDSSVARHLKTIILYGSGKSWKTQLQLVEFLLKRAGWLNELFIVPIKHRLEAAEELEFVKCVSRLPRASTSAKVLFG